MKVTMMLAALASGAAFATSVSAASTAECGDYWQKNQAYSSGQIVSHAGQNYRANWWTQAMRPDRAASSAEWMALGACEYPAVSQRDLTANQVTTLTSPSVTVGNQYRIEIHLPQPYQPDRAYPVLYVADWDLLNNRDVMQQMLQMSGHTLPPEQMTTLIEQYQAARSTAAVEPIIIVGIACLDDLLSCMVRRERDFTPTHWQAEDDWVRGDLIPDLPANQTITGGAPAFTRFVQQQLIPSVERRFRVDPKQRALHGTSLSGLYAADVLLNQPQLFSHYQINSPSLWYQDLATLNQAVAASEKSLKPITRAVVTVGENEADMVTMADALASTLRGKRVDAPYVLLNNADHALAALQASRQALPLLFPAQ